MVERYNVPNSNRRKHPHIQYRTTVQYASIDTFTDPSDEDKSFGCAWRQTSEFVRPTSTVPASASGELCKVAQELDAEMSYFDFGNKEQLLKINRLACRAMMRSTEILAKLSEP